MIEPVDFIAMTVKMEAEGEDFTGKLCVAYVIVNRMQQRRQSASDVVLAPFQFSCWNTKEPPRLRLDDQETHRQVWIDSYKAAWAALYGILPDPTRGCTSYLNPAACTPQQKKNAGYVESAVRLKHGRHHFFIET